MFVICVNWHQSKRGWCIFSLTSNRLPKVLRAHNGMGRRARGAGSPWEERVPAVPLTTRLSPSKVAPRPRHFLLYNRMRPPTECDTRIYSGDVTRWFTAPSNRRERLLLPLWISLFVYVARWSMPCWPVSLNARERGHKYVAGCYKMNEGQLSVLMVKINPDKSHLHCREWSINKG